METVTIAITLFKIHASTDSIHFKSILKGNRGLQELPLVQWGFPTVSPHVPPTNLAWGSREPIKQYMVKKMGDCSTWQADRTTGKM